MVSSCAVHEMEDLNISDHLPISMELSWTVAKTGQQCDFQWDRRDWKMVKGSGALEAFQAEVQAHLGHFLGGMQDDNTHLDSEIRKVAQLLVDTARRTTP